MEKATIHRFGPCEIDEAQRALTVHGREIRVQPRVFDLLCYLVRHRARVVSKDELLDALWPGTVVVDNALQRAVSLARAALAEAGLPDAVRTYPRHGYRFHLDDPCRSDGAAAAAGVDDAGAPLAQARAALDRMDWAAACEAFAIADAQAPLAASDVEQWGRAAICAGLGSSVLRVLERTVAERDGADDRLGAARATLLLVQIRIDARQGTIASGLLQRAARYLEGHQATPERGHYAWMASRLALATGDLDAAFTLGDEALTLGRMLRDADVECLGLVYRGHALIARGQVAEGLAQHEEAAAITRLGGVCAWAAGWTLCSVLYAARNRCDWLRASQFADAYSEWGRASRMPAFPGTCQLHRAAVLGAKGDLEDARTEVRNAARELAQVAPWAEGDAYCVLGEIQLSMGDLEGAEASLRQAHALGWDPQPSFAILHMRMGRHDAALRELERALVEADWGLRERRGQLLCLLAQAAVMAGHPERAREALDVLATDPQMLATDALKGMHAAAEAELAAADGDVERAVQRLRRSVQHWREAGCRVGEAEARLRLAECLLDDGDATGSELELHAVESRLASAALAHRSRMDALRLALHPVARTPSN